MVGHSAGVDCFGYGFAWIDIQALVVGGNTAPGVMTAERGFAAQFASGMANYEDCPNAINIGNLHHCA
jgi:hypothetical protein